MSISVQFCLLSPFLFSSVESCGVLLSLVKSCRVLPSPVVFFQAYERMPFL
jgi:hypothetical protein